MQYRNPIIPGFFPDPSICLHNGTYYMVCSSFHYFPGVPLFESHDLLNWTQIGHVLTRSSQLALDDADSSGGIYAPTIRCNGGRFYMVTTNVSAGGNFYVYTDDIYGEWSDPVYVEQDGIDPSLYFEDGHAYFMSNGTDDSGVHGIVQCEIDIETGRKLSPARCIWKGTGGRFLESPHLYKRGEDYYIMASEGGTEYGHMVVYGKGKDIYGPFESFKGNPVLTNRSLGGYLLQGCGHGDLVCDPSGNWWMVHLGFRQIHEWIMHHITGREVYLVPVTFDAEGWFTAGYDGTTLLEMETDRIPETTKQFRLEDTTFANSKPGVDWCWIRRPDENCYDLTSSAFRLKSNGLYLDACTGSPAFVALRQREMEQTISCNVSAPEGEAGLTMYMGPDQYYAIGIRRTADGWEVLRRLRVGDLIQEDGILPCPGKVRLTIRCTHLRYCFFAEWDGKEHSLGDAQTKFLSTEVAGNFTGVMAGLYAQGHNVRKFAEFTDYHCQYGK